MLIKSFLFTISAILRELYEILSRMYFKHVLTLLTRIEKCYELNTTLYLGLIGFNEAFDLFDLSIIIRVLKIPEKT